MPVLLKARLVPVATPRTGVINVGLVSTTNVVPVPVFDAIEVAFPTEVIGPVKFAFVVTVEALVAEVAFPLRAPAKVVVVRVLVEGLNVNPVAVSSA